MTEFNFRFVTPANAEELEAYKDDLAFLGGFIPWAKFMDVALASVPDLTLVYDGAANRILGGFTLDVYAKTVEVLGVCRQDLRQVYPKEVARFIMPAFTQLLLQHLFVTMGKKNVVLKVLDASLGGRGFALFNGFKKINREKKLTVYRLTRNEYLERMNDGQERTESQSKQS